MVPAAAADTPVMLATARNVAALRIIVAPIVPPRLGLGGGCEVAADDYDPGSGPMDTGMSRAVRAIEMQASRDLERLPWRCADGDHLTKLGFDQSPASYLIS